MTKIKNSLTKLDKFSNNKSKIHPAWVAIAEPVSDLVLQEEMKTRKQIWKQARKQTIFRALLCGFLLTVVFSFFSFQVQCQAINESVLRLHVLANSDSQQDQEVKLKVRDAVLVEAVKWYKDADSLDEANAAISTHLQSIEEVANSTLALNDKIDIAKAEVTDMYFTTRDYDKFILPAGKYRTLRVTIGEGVGKNWWCMVYPALCLPASEKNNEEDIIAKLPESTKKIILKKKDYTVKFKFVEWIEEIKKQIEKLEKIERVDKNKAISKLT